MKNLILSGLFMFCMVTVFSQTMSEVRYMRFEAISVFDKYHSLLSEIEYPTIYSKDNFLDMFEENALVYNDILPNNQPQFLSPTEYFDRYVSLVRNLPVLKDLEVGFPYLKDNKWYVLVKFKKIIKTHYRKRNLSYPEWYFNYEMLVVMEEKEDVKEVNITNSEMKSPFHNAKISSLMVKYPLNEYYVIQFNDSLLSEEVKGLYYLPEQYQVEIIDELNRRIFNAKDYNRTDFGLNNEIEDDYILLEQQDSIDPCYWVYNVKPVKNLFGVVIDFSPIKAGLIESKDELSGIKLDKVKFSVAFTYGRLLLFRNKHKLYFNIKPGYELTSLKFTGSHYDEFSSVDADGDNYIRKIELNNVDEHDVFHSIDLPLSIGYVKSINNYSFTYDLGVWCNYSLYNDHRFSSDAYYSGFYPQFWNLTIDKNGYYDFGNYGFKSHIANRFHNTFDYGVWTSIGLMYKIKKGLHLKADLSYRIGFVDRSSYDSRYIISKDYNNYSPLLYSIKEWTTNDLKLSLSILKKL